MGEHVFLILSQRETPLGLRQSLSNRRTSHIKLTLNNSKMMSP